jgi:hypothetical protein
MPNQNDQPGVSGKEKREIKVRDLKPETDPKGGAADANEEDRRPSGRTGEADFMEGLK